MERPAKKAQAKLLDRLAAVGVFISSASALAQDCVVDLSANPVGDECGPVLGPGINETPLAQPVPDMPQPALVTLMLGLVLLGRRFFTRFKG